MIPRDNFHYCITEIKTKANPSFNERRMQMISSNINRTSLIVYCMVLSIKVKVRKEYFVQIYF